MKNDSHLNDPAVCDGIPLHLNFMRKKKQLTVIVTECQEILSGHATSQLIVDTQVFG